MGAAEQRLAEAVHADASAWGVEARALARIAVADTLAIGIAGMAEEQVTIARSTVLVNEHPQSVAGWTGTDRYFPADAAFVLGVAAHSLDWDDYMHPMHGHCSSVLLPVVWALGGEHPTAETLIDAYLAGYQVNYLAGQALGHSHYRRGWHATSTAGTLGAAAAAARMLRLTKAQTVHALGLAASSASGLRVNFGTATKAIHAGTAARHGVQAAQLALAGLTASPDWLLGEHGMVETFGGDRAGSVALDAMRAADSGHGIASGWGLVQKPYCCCGSCHAAVEAVITLVTEHDIAPADIATLRVTVDPIVVAIMQVDEPWDQYSARYSPTWAMAAAAIDRLAGPQQFAREALVRSDIRELRERVVIVPELDTSDDDRFAGLAQIELVNGRLLRCEIRHALGHPQRPMSAVQRASKQAQALDGVELESLPALTRELLELG